MEAKIYLSTFDVATLKKRDVPIVRLHFQTQPWGIEGVENINKALTELEAKLGVAINRCDSGEKIYGEWL